MTPLTWGRWAEGEGYAILNPSLDERLAVENFERDCGDWGVYWIGAIEEYLGVSYAPLA